MNKIIKTIYAVCICFPFIAFSQTSPIESRIVNLEAKVKELETRLAKIEGAATTASKAPIAQPKAPETLPVTLLKKTYKMADATDGDRIEFIFEFSNTKMRSVTGFSGTVSILDKVSKTELLSFSLTSSNLVESMDKLNWLGVINIDATNGNHKRLINAAGNDLELRFSLEKISYADGNAEVFK